MGDRVQSAITGSLCESAIASKRVPEWVTLRNHEGAQIKLRNTEHPRFVAA
jgi:hypothetical protein